MNKEQIVAFTIFTVYLIFDMTMVTYGKFHLVLKFVRMTTKSCSVVKIDAFTKYSDFIIPFRRYGVLCNDNKLLDFQCKFANVSLFE